MRLENGCLFLEPTDLDNMQESINKGLSVEETFNHQLNLWSIDKEDIFEVQAFARDLMPYEKMIIAITTLI